MPARILLAIGLVLLAVSLASLVYVHALAARPPTATRWTTFVPRAANPTVGPTIAPAPSPAGPTIGPQPTQAEQTPVPSIGPAPTPTPAPDLSPTPTLTPTQVPPTLVPTAAGPADIAMNFSRLPGRGASPKPTQVNEAVSASWPTSMERNGETDRFTLTFQHFIAGSNRPGTPEPGATETTSKPAFPPDATPGASLELAYGPGYQAMGRPVFDHTGLTIDPENAEEKPLSSLTRWTWTATATGRDTLHLDMTLTVRWIPLHGGQEHSFDAWDQPLNVKVTEPWVTLGQINILGLLGTFVGGTLLSGLSIPWFLANLRTRRDDEPPPPRRSPPSHRKAREKT